MAARDELVAAIAGRADRMERGRILDEFTAITGFHRKHAMRLLRAGQPKRRSGPRRGRRVYEDATRETLIVIWEASDRICGKRLRPLVPVLVEAMERHGHLRLAYLRQWVPCRWAAILARGALCAAVEPGLHRRDRAQGRPLPRAARGNSRSPDLGQRAGPAP